MPIVSRVGDGVDEEADGNNDDCRGDEGYDDESRSGDFLVDSIGKGDVGVDEGEGTVVGGDLREEDACNCYDSVVGLVFKIGLKER